jgi:hypothetical protein
MAQEQSGAPMFRAEIAPEAGILSWVIQQIAAPLPLVFWALLVSPLERVVAPWLQVSRNGFDLLLYLPAGWTLSFLFAILVQRKFPVAIVFGRWIWVLPVLLLALAFCSDAARFSIIYAFALFFYPGLEGEGQWAFALATCPTGSAIAYSLGMIWSAHRQASKALAARNSDPGDASEVTVSSSP